MISIQKSADIFPKKEGGDFWKRNVDNVDNSVYNSISLENHVL